jgi:hypothetical protein
LGSGCLQLGSERQSWSDVLSSRASRYSAPARDGERGTTRRQRVPPVVPPNQSRNETRNDVFAFYHINQYELSALTLTYIYLICVLPRPRAPPRAEPPPPMRRAHLFPPSHFTMVGIPTCGRMSARRRAGRTACGPIREFLQSNTRQKRRGGTVQECAVHSPRPHCRERLRWRS